MDPPAHAPKEWPVVEPDLLMSYVDSVLVIRIGAEMTRRSFHRYLEEWTRSVDARPEDAGVFAMYDLPE